VHANDYNTMWIGIAAKLLRGSRLVYDCHELWADRNGRPEWRPWLLACEALFVRLADVTITASPGYATAIAGRYRVSEPVVVRNIPSERPSAPDRVDRAGPPLAVYVGGLMPGRGLEQAIEALALVPGMRLRLIGPSSQAYRAALEACAERAGVADRVQIAAAVAPTSVVDAIGQADLGLMLIQPVCRSYELTLPNKLFEYAAAGLPMLTSDLPVIGPLVRAEGLGEVVPPTDIALIASGLSALAEPDRNRDTRARVRSFAERVTWDNERAVLEQAYTDGRRASTC
jgi:glycosyltransferase involved in cell wall biosynthesis